MRAMVLAAGFGTRLHPLTFNYPKSLIRIHQHYLIDYALAALKRAGIKEVIINIHHCAEQVQSAVGDGSAYGMALSYSFEETILGTGGAIKNAESFLNTDPFVVINSDIICDIDLRSVIEEHKGREAHATMVVRKDPALPNHDEIKMDRSYRVVSINQEYRDISQADHLGRMFTGIHVLSPVVFSYLSLKFSSIITDFYQKAIADRLNIYGYEYDEFWMDLGTPESLELAQKSGLPEIRF